MNLFGGNIIKKKIVFLFILVVVLANPLTFFTNGKYIAIHESKNNVDFSKLDSEVLIRIYIEGQEHLPSFVSEVVSSKPGEWIDVIIPANSLSFFSNTNIKYSVLVNDVELYFQSFASQYYSLEEMEQVLQNISTKYPNITNLYSIGQSYEGRDIWCLEISDNPGVDEDEPGVFFMGLHHAREWPSLAICVYIAEKLTSQYGIDSEITDMVNNRRIWIVSCVNPDGYYYCHDLMHDWRKNRHYFPESDTYGVDLNRNYAGSCNGDVFGAWGSKSSGATSNDPSSQVYCGPIQFSEPEIQAIRDIYLENDICASISWHTYGELVLWPWGYTYDNAPDDEYLSLIGREIASRITSQDGSSTYYPEQGSELYPVVGDTDDWAYGYGHYVQGRPTFAYTIEACSSFHPGESSLDQVCSENYDGAFYLLREAENICETVAQRVMPPVIDNIISDNEGNYIVSWDEKNPNAKPDYFQLDEMTDLSLVTDDADIGTALDLWTMDGFCKTNKQYHSAGSCYKSTSLMYNPVTYMTSKYPLPISTGMNLSFWCYYNGENYTHYAFIEVSKDGRSYDMLDAFTGHSNGWEYKQYSLDEYNGESIFIRFRYTTDTTSKNYVFYVDDITPVSYFLNIDTLSDTINENYFEITNKPLGTYFYRVKGYNQDYGWGDFSKIKSIQINSIDNKAPTPPNIDGPKHVKPGDLYEYKFISSDPDGDDLYYYIDWGDGTDSGWMGPYPSSEDITVEHTWNEKNLYVLKAKAKDIHELEGNWNTILVSMQKNKIHFNYFFVRFFERLLSLL